MNHGKACMPPATSRYPLWSRHPRSVHSYYARMLAEPPEWRLNRGTSKTAILARLLGLLPSGPKFADGASPWPSVPSHGTLWRVLELFGLARVSRFDWSLAQPEGGFIRTSRQHSAPEFQMIRPGIRRMSASTTSPTALDSMCSKSRVNPCDACSPIPTSCPPPTASAMLRNT